MRYLVLLHTSQVKRNVGCALSKAAPRSALMDASSQPAYNPAKLKAKGCCTWEPGYWYVV